MKVCDCGTWDNRHDYGCRGWRDHQPTRTPLSIPQPRTDVPDPWGWAERGIPNPDIQE